MKREKIDKTYFLNDSKKDFTHSVRVSSLNFHNEWTRFRIEYVAVAKKYKFPIYL